MSERMETMNEESDLRAAAESLIPRDFVLFGDRDAYALREVQEAWLGVGNDPSRTLDESIREARGNFVEHFMWRVRSAFVAGATAALRAGAPAPVPAHGVTPGTTGTRGGAAEREGLTYDAAWRLVEDVALTYAQTQQRLAPWSDYEAARDRALAALTRRRTPRGVVRDADEGAGGAELAEAVAEAVTALRRALRATVMPVTSDETPPLRDALIGQCSDAAFWTQWEGNKAALVRLLDAIDAASQHAARAATPAREGDADDR